MAAPISIPPYYRGAVYDKLGEISTKILEMKVPKPGVGEVLVNLTHSGVCHSDLAVMDNAWKLPFPIPKDLVGGHEGVGKIVQIGPGAEKYGFVVGDRVGIKWLRDICGTCEYCIAGHDGLCRKKSASGCSHHGTFQQYLTAPAHYVTPIPAGLSSAVAAPMLCAGLTAYAALQKTNPRPGNWVVVSGAGGGVGHLAVQLAAKAFGQRVIGIDQSAKRNVARDSGAEEFIDVAQSSGDMVAEVKKITGGLGAHAVIVCAASNAAYAQGVELLRPGGTLVGVGMPGGEPIPIATARPSLMAQNELRITGSILGNQQDAKAVLELAARGIISLHYKTKRLEDLTQVFQDMKKGSLVGRVVIDLQD